MRIRRFFSASGLLIIFTVPVLVFSGCAGPRPKVAIPTYHNYPQAQKVVYRTEQRTPSQVLPRPENRQSPGTSQDRPFAVEHMGYSIQVGAFAKVDNAIRLTKKLEKQGLEAFYFAHKSGLYKVRFGNYRSLQAASAEAKRLRNIGMIEVFYVVKPGEYIIARGGKPPVQGRGENIRDEIVDTAHSFIGLPYQWGSCSLQNNSFDCSGLVLAVYQLNGLNVPRTSQDQYFSGQTIMKEDLQKGDLVFFNSSGNGRITHVGIYIGDDKFIHAPGTGKTICTDSLSSSYFRDHFYGACTYLR
jgi:cell wall-associated NlpC family hydrolase